jgi:capsular polysaccharide biosynthesis protein
MISCSVKAEAALFTVNVSSENPELAKSVLQTIESNAPAVIDDTVKRNNCVEVITFAKDAKKVGNNNVRNALFAFAIAAIMAYVLFLIIALLDTTVNTEDDLKNKFDLPILGVIPEWMTASKHD